MVFHLMASHTDNLTAMLCEHNLSAGLVVASDGSTLSRVGDFRAAECESLMSALVGPFGDARVTFDSLDGQQLPRMWSQGESFAFVDKPSTEFMVIVFGHEVSPVEQYQLSKRVSASIREKWITGEGSGPDPRV